MPCHAERHRPQRRQLGARDQVRRLPDAGAHRKRHGHAEDAHRPRLDESLSDHCREPAPRSTTTRCCSTARSSRATPNGVSNFSALQDDLKTGRHDRLAYYVFDLLHLDGYDLTGAPLIDRKAHAASRCSRRCRTTASIRLSEHFDTDGPTLLRHACEMQLEGILSKRSDAPYRSGRSGDWLKTKCSNSQEFVVAGFEPSDKRRRAIRSLLLGYYDKDELRYAGRVGTGWGEAKERDLSRRLAAVAADKPPFETIPAEERRRKVKWVKPRARGRDRFPRLDRRNPAAAGLVQGLARGQAGAAGGAGDRVRCRARPSRRRCGRRRRARPRRRPSRKSRPRREIRSRGRRRHADAIPTGSIGTTPASPSRISRTTTSRSGSGWRRMSPAACSRWCAAPTARPDNASTRSTRPPASTRSICRLVPEPDGDKSIAIDELAGLVSLAQAGVLEVHVRGSTHRASGRSRPAGVRSRSGPGHRMEGHHRRRARGARATEDAQARKLRQDHRRQGAARGAADPADAVGRGQGLLPPLRRGDGRRTSRSATPRPSRRRRAATASSSTILRNSREATAIAPYSTRARPGATVSAPLTWEELGKQKSPNFYTVENLPKRLAKLRKDPWADIGQAQAEPAGEPRTVRRVEHVLNQRWPTSVLRRSDRPWRTASAGSDGRDTSPAGPARRSRSQTRTAPRARSATPRPETPPGRSGARRGSRDRSCPAAPPPAPR